MYPVNTCHCHSAIAVQIIVLVPVCLKAAAVFVVSGWVNTLVGGEKHGANGFMFFIVNVDLTEEGIGTPEFCFGYIVETYIAQRSFGDSLNGSSGMKSMGTWSLCDR